MTVNIYPEGISVNDLKGAEKVVFQELRRQLPDGSDIFCHVERIHEKERREIDFVVSIPGEGLAILEVKGGSIRIENGRWEQARQNGWKKLSIASQLDAERRMLRDILRAEFGWGEVPTVRMVVVPDTAISVSRKLPEVAREFVIDQGQMSAMPAAIFKAMKINSQGTKFNEASQEKVRKALGEAGIEYDDYVEEAESRADLVEQLTREQIFILDLMSGNQRLNVRGGPGTGKTILAIEMAFRHARQGKRVALVCHNRGLASYLKSKLSELSPQWQPVLIGNFFDDLPAHWGIELPAVPESDIARKTFYQESMPRHFHKFAESLPLEDKFDVWVVDEAQDFLTSQFEIMKMTLKDPVNGGIYLFGDPDQDLYDSAGEVPWFTANAKLNRNVRSSRKIAEFVNGIEPKSAAQPWGVIAGWQPEFRIVEKRNDVLGNAEIYLDTLLNEFLWRKKDVALLTTHAHHSKHLEGRSNDDDAYWNEFFHGSSVFYGRVNSFKGLERPVVVIALNGESESEKQLQQMYVGASRARDDLIIFGTREDLELLGKAADQLNVID
jgi:hypothetical protein